MEKPLRNIAQRIFDLLGWGKEDETYSESKNKNTKSFPTTLELIVNRKNHNFKTTDEFKEALRIGLEKADPMHVLRDVVLVPIQRLPNTYTILVMKDEREVVCVDFPLSEDQNKFFVHGLRPDKPLPYSKNDSGDLKTACTVIVSKMRHPEEFPIHPLQRLAISG